MKKRLLIFLLIAILLILIGYNLYLRSYDFEKEWNNNFQNVDCDRFTGSYHPPQYSYTIPERAICLITQAWFNKDINYCNRIEESAYRDSCIKLTAIISRDAEKCKLISSRKDYSSIEREILEDKKSNAWLYECYGNLATLGDYPDACHLIPFKSTDMLEGCIQGATDGKNLLGKTHAPFGVHGYTEYQYIRNYL